LIYETGSLVTCCYILITFYISDTTCSILTPIFEKIMIFFHNISRRIIQFFMHLA
jgi:hypothetical protein